MKQKTFQKRLLLLKILCLSKASILLNPNKLIHLSLKASDSKILAGIKTRISNFPVGNNEKIAIITSAKSAYFTSFFGIENFRTKVRGIKTKISNKSKLILYSQTKVIRQ